MNRRMIINSVGLVLRVEAALLLLPAAVGMLYGEKQTLIAFLISAAISLLLGLLPKLFLKPKTHVIYAKEGFIIVAFTWIMLSLVGAVPLVLAGAVTSYADAFFEIVSGFTTTGSSVIPDVEVLSHGALFWRSFTHWVGGMGIIVFVMAILPNVSERPIHILRAEIPGPTVGKLVPRIKDTALILYLIYIVMTVIETVMLLFGGMSFFESLLHTFGTAGTGGFGIKTDSMTSYSPYLQTVTTVFMLLFGVNFTCYYLLMIGQVSAALRDEELRVYAGTFAVATLLITLNVKELVGGFFPALHHAAFQVASIMTTTGFATTDFSLWPSFSKAILVLLMFTGAMAGSTGGGLKFARVLLLFKSAGRSIRKVLNPQSVRTVRVNRKAVEEKTVDGTATYFILYIGLLLGSFLLLSLDGFSFETNFTAVLSCLNNIGPGLDAVGPAANYAGYGILSKLVLSFDMLAGRLELFPILVLFSTKAWKRA